VGLRWRREWDSNSEAFFRICKLHIPQCHGCHRCQRYRGALPAVARQSSVGPPFHNDATAVYLAGYRRAGLLAWSILMVYIKEGL
jgi:hypothetical protein